MPPQARDPKVLVSSMIPEGGDGLWAVTPQTRTGTQCVPNTASLFILPVSPRDGSIPSGLSPPQSRTGTWCPPSTASPFTAPASPGMALPGCSLSL